MSPAMVTPMLSATFRRASVAEARSAPPGMAFSLSKVKISGWYSEGGSVFTHGLIAVDTISGNRFAI
jgi:hypothetical protein